MTDLSSIADDLRAEQESLDAVVANLTPEQWRTSTPSPGWTVADQIGHLAYFDGTALLALTDRAGFQKNVEALMASSGRTDGFTLFRDLVPEELVLRWRANRAQLLDAAATLTHGERVAWYGPTMSAESFLTARLMECWAHGTDIVDAVDGDRAPTDRLRHVAQIGYITRRWSYVNRGEQPPVDGVRVELASPSGADRWTFGPEDAEATVRGPGEDFCLVVTQRRHVDDTSLIVRGDIARDWMQKAQTFAGPPTDGPSPAREQ